MGPTSRRPSEDAGVVVTGDVGPPVSEGISRVRIRVGILSTIGQSPCTYGLEKPTGGTRV